MEKSKPENLPANPGSVKAGTANPVENPSGAEIRNTVYSTRTVKLSDTDSTSVIQVAGIVIDCT